MTGHSHAGPIRVLLRAPPHLPFLQSYPGIPAGGKHPSSSVEGTVEVRLRDPVKAKWIRIEVRKHESVPGTLTGKMGQQSTVHVGKVQELWKASDGKEFESIESTDYRFVVPLPENLPPSVDIRGCSIRYELVAAVCYKGKGGLFKKDNSQYATVSEPLRITKYELASAWPVYNQVERKMVQADNGAVTLIVDRPSQAFGPGDRIVVTAAIKTTPASKPFRLKGFEMTLVEIFTIVPSPPPPTKKKNKPPPAPIVKKTSLCTTRAAMEANITPGTERGARLDLVVPSDRSLLTVRHAQEFKVEYELIVDAACEGGPGRIAGNGLSCIIGTFPRSSAQQAVKDIGYVPGLCPRGPGVSGHQPHPSIAASLSATSLQGGPSPSTSPAPPRGQQSSSALRGNHLSPDPSAFYRPLSSYPTTPPQAQQHQQQLSPQQYPQQQQQVRPPVPPVIGFVPRDPRDPNKWARRSSSGTTTTTATTATGLTDHGPLVERNVSTMPVGGSRGSLAFPSPNPSRHPQESPFGPMLEEREPRYESLPNRLQPRGGGGAHSELGHGAQQRLSAAPPSHPMWTPGQYDRVNDSSSPTTTMTDDTSQAPQTPTRPQSVNITPTRAQPTQSQANRQSVGAPPEYTPPPRSSTPVNSGTAQSIHSSPQSIRSGPSSPVAGAAAVSPASPRFPSSAQEKQQLRYMAAIAARDARSAPGAGPAGGTSSNGSAATSPVGASGATATAPPQPHPSEEPIPYDQIFPSGPSSAAAGSSQPPAPAGTAKPYMSAAEEKDMMRKRYEEAQNKVARATGQQPSLNGHSPVTGVSPVTSPGSSVQGHGRAASQSYMTAAEEKDMMRRRYEEAQRGVARATGTGDSPGAGPGPASQPPASSSAASSSAATAAAAAAPYMSAAEEKDMMRKRYEDAQRRVNQTQAVDGGSVTSSPVAGPGQALAAAPHIDSPPPPPPAAESQAFLSAAEEKEMMRRRYEGAVNAVERNTGVDMSPTAGSSSRVVSGGSVAAPPQPQQQSPVTTSPAYMSAAEEKEMMRRRYEGAVDAVERNTGVDIAPGTGAGSSSRVVSASSSQPPQRQQSTPATSPAYMSAAEEKEMMRRRYEGAVNAVERATGSDVGSPVGPSARNVSSGSTNQPNYSAMSPEARYHLAKMRVERAQTASPTGSSPVASPAAALHNSAAHSPATTQSHSGRSPASYMSAAEEKEMMRRRYEDAQNAVARAAGVGDSPGAGPSSTTTATASATGPANSAPPPPADEPIPYDELFGPARSTSGPSGPSAKSTPTTMSSPATYMSAAEEKDMMRRRYEEAQHAVSRNMGGASGSGSGGRGGSGVDGGGAGAGSKSEPSWSPTDTTSNTASQPLSADPKSTAPKFMSAEEEKEMMRKRFESAQAAVNHAASNAGGGAGPKPGMGAGASSGMSGTMPSPSSSSSSPTAGVAPPGPPGRSRTMMSMGALPDGPPPPLAPRPPRDYVERLNRE